MKYGKTEWFKCPDFLQTKLDLPNQYQKSRRITKYVVVIINQE